MAVLRMAHSPIAWHLSRRFSRIASGARRTRLLTLETREYVAIARDVASATTWRDMLGYIFGPPGWEPAGRGTISACALFSTVTSTRD